MNIAPDVSQPLESRVIRLEEWRIRTEERGVDHERRIRDLEAARMRESGKFSVLAVLGSAVATAAIHLIFRAVGS